MEKAVKWKAEFKWLEFNGKKIIFTDQKNKQMGKNSNTIIKTKESNTLILIEFLNHKS